MGVTLSTESSLAPISLASILVGFISFAFTFATFLRVTWQNYITILSASNQIHDLLGNLKQGLYEERAHLRRVRKLQRRRNTYGTSAYDKENIGVRLGGDGDDIATKVMRDAIRHMISEFRGLERPFLKDDDGRRYHDVRNGEGFAEEDEDDYYLSEYRPCGLRERWLWLRSKGDVEHLFGALTRLETRRMAKEVGEATLVLSRLGRDLQDVDDRLYELEQRLSRVVGIRRVG
ncbi:hypothetical protein K490DRAFT_62249 [Saccharata proteae CBS 121410]|uniref:Uncharacterized protein n=1 Tax=Saccharata proteae CBS 121410 TaxID=1314787 RepID=A0A9P4I2C9_9PEZI|nr:hypothetical protein K490DRAFT_62249 [Saccharata proteae CBS 121410]